MQSSQPVWLILVCIYFYELRDLKISYSEYSNYRKIKLIKFIMQVQTIKSNELKFCSAISWKESGMTVIADNTSPGSASKLERLAAAPAETTGPVGGSQSLNILLVEDDDADAYLIERALSSNPRVGAIVRARDGVEALELVDARRMKPDLAIVDLHMPRKDGFALLAELRARVTVEFPSVVLTSSRSGADALRSRKRGCVEYVTKPNGMAKMTIALDRIIAAA